MRISDLVTFLTEGIFRLRPEQIHNPFLRWAARQYKLLFYTVQGLSTHGTMVRSAAMTFYTLISIVPIVALIFAVLKGFGMTDDLVQNLYGLLPQMPEVVDYVVDFPVGILRAPIVDSPDGCRIRKVLCRYESIKIILKKTHIAVADAEVIVNPYGIGRLDLDSIIPSKVLSLIKHSSQGVVKFDPRLSFSTFS